MKQSIFIILTGLMAACSVETGIMNSGDMDWRIFRGDATLSGYTSNALPKKPVLKWTYKGGMETMSSPVVDKGTSYWPDKGGYIRGVNMNGELIFVYDLHSNVEGSPLLYDSTLYIGQANGNMTAISLSAKDTLWNFRTFGKISASPNLVKFAGRKSIVFGSYDHYLYFLDAKNGKQLGKFITGNYIKGSPALWKDHVIFGGGDNRVRIIDCKKRLQTDSLHLDTYIPSSAAVMGDYCYIGDYSGKIYKLMLEDGKIIRHKKIVSEYNNNNSYVSTPALSSDAFYYFAGTRYLHSVSRINGKLNWKYPLKGNSGSSSPVVCDDKIIVCTKTGIISILDSQKGTLLWEYDAGEPIVGSPAVIKDHFLILTKKGTLLCFGEEK